MNFQSLLKPNRVTYFLLGIGGLLILILGSLVLWWTPDQAQTEVVNQEESATQEVLATPSSAPFYSLRATVADQSALELLDQNADVELQDYGDLGQMITGIDGLIAGDSHYWGIYVNGEYAQQGIADLVLQPGDTLELRYEALE